MLGLDACELGEQLLELLRLALCARVLLADKDGESTPSDEVLDEIVPEYQAPGKKSMLAIWQLDPGDVSLVKYKQALLGPLPPIMDPSLPNVQVTRLTLLTEQAPGPIIMDLTGDLDALKNQVFVLKEGIEYKVKITFKVNKEIVSGLKCLHHTYRRGLSEDKKNIILEEGKEILVGDVGQTVDDPYTTFVKMLPDKDCRYALYDATYETKESKKEDLVFIFWAPENAPLKSKMIYASSKDAIKKKLTGIKHELQANCYEEVKDRCTLAEKLGGSAVISPFL